MQIKHLSKHPSKKERQAYMDASLSEVSENSDESLTESSAPTINIQDIMKDGDFNDNILSITITESRLETGQS